MATAAWRTSGTVARSAIFIFRLHSTLMECAVSLFPRFSSSRRAFCLFPQGSDKAIYFFVESLDLPGYLQKEFQRIGSIKDFEFELLLDRIFGAEVFSSKRLVYYRYSAANPHPFAKGASHAAIEGLTSGNSPQYTIQDQ